MRGSYKPLGISGRSLIDALFVLNPEIYGSIADPEKVELNGLLYILERLPDGIEECRYIKLIAREGFREQGYEPIVPPKRRRNCYRIDEHRMYIEMTRGRSDTYDILTHLTFMFIEAEKVKRHVLDKKGNVSDDWLQLEKIVKLEAAGKPFDERKAMVYLSTFLGRTVRETQEAVDRFNESSTKNSLYHIIYWLGRTALEETLHDRDKEISFSSRLREIVGQHIYGEKWAHKIKSLIHDNDWHQRPIHIVSANLHSFLNMIYGPLALGKKFKNINDLASQTSIESNSELRKKIKKYGLKHGLHEVKDESGTNLSVQLFDISEVDQSLQPNEAPVIVVMDYAFGEQAFECMDELIKPYELEGVNYYFNIRSISIIGKAGILTGEKGDIMLPTAHVFEGTADNYPLENDLCIKDFENSGIPTFEGPMITVLGTSLQNKDVLHHFMTSTWNV